MKLAVGSNALGIASGITPQNAVDYLSVADAFLVATGFSRSFTEFGPVKVRALAQTVRHWEPPLE